VSGIVDRDGATAGTVGKHTVALATHVTLLLDVQVSLLDLDNRSARLAVELTLPLVTGPTGLDHVHLQSSFLVSSA
jgi:hypothetical protein